ncbi:hypothetical protein MTR67_002554 [Solanum verrucosum]|uniref:Tf2-1-like SH3-like domain-containing protein n=1 Tax=Solanum verrucosum TaxID=315347 RepID=A0AAF0PWE3_SOLVR|nr:hypothetical protein MTR67_002554 [Solanum verrucosum]
MKGVMRYGNRGKLSSRYIRLSEILHMVREVRNKLEFPMIFLDIHLVFHVSMLCRYVPDEPHVLQYDAVELNDRLTFVEETVVILPIDVWRLRSSASLIVKVPWRNPVVDKAT